MFLPGAIASGFHAGSINGAGFSRFVFKWNNYLRNEAFDTILQNLNVWVPIEFHFDPPR